MLNPLQKEERFNAIVREAVKTLCSGETARSFKRRMEDMALYFLETNRADAAKLALAVALQVGEADPGCSDISFLTGLVQKEFCFLHVAGKGKAGRRTILADHQAVGRCWVLSANSHRRKLAKSTVTLYSQKLRPYAISDAAAKAIFDRIQEIYGHVDQSS